MTSRVLILGASYGSLIATRLLMAGHRVAQSATLREIVRMVDDRLENNRRVGEAVAA